MMTPTHAAIAVATTTLCFDNPTFFSISLAVIGSVLPDLDTSKSFAGRLFLPLSRWIEERHSHRTVTHSLLGTLTIAAISSPLLYYSDLKTWLALPLGHLSACLADSFTKQGVGLFWPLPHRAVFGNNPHLRLTTGSPAEYWLLAFFVCVSSAIVYLQTQGGFMLNFNRLIGIKAGITHVYNLYGKNHHVWVDLKGHRINDRSPLGGEFLLIAQEGEEYILQNREGIYKTEENITVNRVVARYGDKALLSEQLLAFNEDDVSQKLQQLQQSYPGAAIYLTGTIDVDAPDELLVYTEPGEYETISQSDKSVTLRHCPLERAIYFLQDQYAYGVVTARIITPQPLF
ncbi:MAG: hypothetical protein N5P05_001240 [Chroococcopsis gigantea SAG 12.99]|jgi:inner membrane protein|nr:metal-dependent hydrolase [Chlorogloea purpurea SAG 13.99]MDV2999634.1 hypothetical protein [Chroococcopsis gigantea SAG 12.99]